LIDSFDPNLVDLLIARTRALGIELHLQTNVTRIEKHCDRLRVESSSNGETRSFDADIVVHGAGRVAEIDDLGLSAAGIEWDIRGVKVNAYLQSVSNPAVYAAGDSPASGGPPLTPVAGYEGGIVATNLLEHNRLTSDYSVVPSVVFTLPPLASVGLQERAARDRGLRFRTHYERTASWYSSRRIAEEASGFKVLIDEKTVAYWAHTCAGLMPMK
jgi:glutathione reductase (NADPH)